MYGEQTLMIHQQKNVYKEKVEPVIMVINTLIYLEMVFAKIKGNKDR